MMKYTDNLLMLAAGYSLYTLTVIFSTQYLSGFNQLIPDIFAHSTSISIGKTFHQAIGSIITGMLLVRFRAKPVLIAFFIAIVVNIESYVLLFTKESLKSLVEYYIANPSAILLFLKPLIILPVITYVVSLFKRTDIASDEYLEN